MTRDISIVIPCRNGAAYIGATLRSAINQTQPPAEIIVVDDGSTDDTRAIAESFGAPVRVHPGAAEGAAVARNTGAQQASGARLMFLDADDLLTPGTLAALNKALDAGPAEAVAMCPWDRLELGGDPDDPLAPWLVRPASNALPRPRQDALAAWLTGTWSPPACVLWTRAGFAASGGWWQGAGLDDDGNLLRRALARGVALQWAPQGLALYRRLPGEEVSYSGRRMQPWGLGVRLASLRDTVAALDKAGRMHIYRAALLEALSELRRDAAAHPEIAQEVDQLRSDVGGPRAWDALAAKAGGIGARAKAWWQERTTPLKTAQQNAIAPSPAKPETAPLVSVIIPTFNRAALVMRAVQSVCAQSYQKLEIIVVDDGSTDATADKLAALSDPRLTVIARENGGVARARNTGVAAAKGAYIAFLDSDDAWQPGKLARQIATLENAEPRTAFCYTGVAMQRDSETVAIRHPTVTGACLTPLLLTNPVHCATSSGLVRREVFDAVGGFDPDLPALEDWEWLQRVARLYDLAAVDEPLTIYNDDLTPDRRSRAFRQNMVARGMLWQRNRHALRRIGAGHLYLLESARRELREPEGDPAKGRALVWQAFVERPQRWHTWPWLGYMMAPAALRDWLRARDSAAHARRRAAKGTAVLPD